MKILLLNGYLDFFVNSADFFIPKNVTFGPFKDNFFHRDIWLNRRVRDPR